MKEEFGLFNSRTVSQSTSYIQVSDANCKGNDDSIIVRKFDFPEKIIEILDQSDIQQQLLRFEYNDLTNKSQLFNQEHIYLMKELASMGFLDFNKNQAMVLCDMNIE